MLLVASAAIVGSSTRVQEELSMLSRFRHYGWNIGSFVALSAAIVAGCGGAADTAKTPPIDTAKKATGDAKPTSTADATKPADAEAKTDKPADKPTPPVVKPSAPKEKFALPNVEITPAEDRKKLVLAGKELSAEACLLDTSVPEMKDEWFSNALRGFAAAPDGSLYAIDNDQKIRHYIPEPGDTCKLAIDASFGDKGLLKLPEDPERIMVLDDGTLVITAWRKLHKYVGGKIESVDCDVKDVFPDGKTGFWHSGDEAKRVDIAAACKETEWKYKGWDAPKPEKGKDPEKFSIQSIRPWEKDFLVHMTIKGDHYLGIHSPDGKLKIKLGKDREKDKNLRDGEDICWAADIEKCAAGLCVLDSNCRRLSAWDPKKGEMIEAVEVGELIGLFYPWPVALVSTKGVSYMAVTNKEKKPENAPKDAKEFSHALIFRIKGLN